MKLERMSRWLLCLMVTVLLISMPQPAEAAAYHEDATLVGIDVSEHQKQIDWEKVKAAGIDYAIIRCGYGRNYTSQDDEYFEYNASECERLGIPYGVYIYSYAKNVDSAKSEAEHVLRLIDGHTLSYPVYYDMEDASTIGYDLAAIAKTFCTTIEAAGYPVGVYANLNWWNNYLTDPCFDQWHRWVAQYNTSCQYTGEYAMWQYTSSGAVNGISGRVDMNFQIGYPEDHGTSGASTSLMTDKDTYVTGEAIQVTASAAKSGAWVAIYGAGDTISPSLASYYWYFVHGSGADYGVNKTWERGQTYNLYEGVCSYRTINGAAISGSLPSGKYQVVVLWGDDYEVLAKKEITIIAPADANSHSLKTDKTVYTVGEDICVTATSYKQGAWIGLYSGNRTVFGNDYIYYYYADCRNGATVMMQEQIANDNSSMLRLPAGTYTVALFADDGYNNVEETVKILITSDALMTDKRVYNYGDPILVTSAYEGDGAWVGLYKDGESYDRDHGGIDSLYWYYLSEQGATFNILDGYANRADEFVAGNYKLILFADSGYTPVTTVTIQIQRVWVDSTIVASTCTTKGSVTNYYSDGTKDVDELPLAAHDYRKTTVEPNCTAAGYTLYTCNACGNSYRSEEVAATGHSHQSVVTKPTCTTGGYTTYTCSVCGNSYRSEEVAATGHSHQSVVTKPTCTTGGYTTYTCSVCGNSYRSEEVAATGHSHQSVVTKPTCTTGGYTTYTCSVCGDSYRSEEVTATGHSYGTGVVTKEPSFTENGEMTYTCGACGVQKTELLPKKESEGVTRVYGETRYTTALKSADLLKELKGVDLFECIVVASGMEFADALSGSYLANQKGAPILLVRNRHQEMDLVKSYIRDNLTPGGTVYLLGGVQAIPAAMELGLEQFTVKRLAGATRYDTNLAILLEAGTEGRDILVCSGKGFADGLSASAVNLPILLVKDALTENQKQFLQNTTGKIYVIGGQSAVNGATERALEYYGPVKRIAGATRYQTSVNVAREFFPQASYAVLAQGGNFPDGLSGGTLAHQLGAPLIMAADGKTDDLQRYAQESEIRSGLVLGGPTLLRDRTVCAVFRVTVEQILNK